MPQQQVTFRFFVTHSWKDIDFAKRLCDDLRANGLDGFFDAYSVKPGDIISEEITRGLEACDIYVPILSRAALKSPWCEEEINAAITLGKLPGRNGRPRIVPVLVEDCQEEMPIFLRSRLFINFAGRYDDALNELLKAFPVSPTLQTLSRLPSEPAPLPPSAQTSPTGRTPPRTWLAVSGVLIGLCALLVLIGWSVAQLAATPTSTLVAQASATVAATPIVAAGTPATGSMATPAATSPIPAMTTATSVRTVTPFPASPTPTHLEALIATSQLQIGQELLAVNKRYSFRFQLNGDLVVYDNITGRSLWASNTNGSQADHLVMHVDGNLVLYTKAGAVVWQSKTSSSQGDYALLMQDDGNLVIIRGKLYEGSVGVVWATNTNQ